MYCYYYYVLQVGTGTRVRYLLWNACIMVGEGTRTNIYLLGTHEQALNFKNKNKYTVVLLFKMFDSNR